MVYIGQIMTSFQYTLLIFHRALNTEMNILTRKERAKNMISHRHTEAGMEQNRIQKVGVVQIRHGHE